MKQQIWLGNTSRADLLYTLGRLLGAAAFAYLVVRILTK
jgi:hypothetical protein